MRSVSAIEPACLPCAKHRASPKKGLLMSLKLLLPGTSLENDILFFKPTNRKDLFQFLNRVWQGLSSQRTLPEMERIVFGLEDYARTHFAEEEACMARIGYPHLEAHKHSHAQFIANVALLGNRIAAGQTVEVELLDLLNDWLAYHIGVTDRQCLEFARTMCEQPV